MISFQPTQLASLNGEERWREKSIGRHRRKSGYSHGVIQKNVHAEINSRCLSLTVASYISLGAQWIWLCHQ